MGIKVSKPTPEFVDNMGVFLNAMNPGSTLNKETTDHRYHYGRYNVAKTVLGVSKIHTNDNFSDPFTKPLVAMISLVFTMSAW